jgi:NAD(P)-dependent dehydrogenase (short-subunit alcohol dehydrogenase family)
VLVSIGSIAQEGSANNASYTASKGALLGMTQGLAREHPDLRANLVVAGYVETELSEG